MNQKSSFIAVAGTAIMIGVLVPAMADAVSLSLLSTSSSSDGGNDGSGPASNITSGSIIASNMTLGNSGSATNSGLLPDKCVQYSPIPTTSCGKTGSPIK